MSSRMGDLTDAAGSVSATGRFHPTRLSTCITVAWSVTIASLAVVGFAALTDISLVQLALTFFLTLVFAMLRGTYRTRMVNDYVVHARRLAESTLVATAIVEFGFELASVSRSGPRSLVLILGSTWGATLLGLIIAGLHTKLLWRRGIARSRTLVVGGGRLTEELVLELNHRPSYGVDVVGVISTGQTSATHPLGRLDQLAETIHDKKVDRLIIGPSVGDHGQVISAARWAAAAGIPVFVVPRLFEMGVGLDSLSPDRLRGYPLVRVQRSSHPQVALRAKRLFDIAVSGSAIVALLPVFVLAALLVKLSGPGPILFTQERIGRHGVPIQISKFRSMRVHDGSDTEWTADDLITPIGNFLRRSSIDELPQLFAILTGDMSLVGPRPERPAFVEEFSEKFPHYRERHRMPVGLTGLAQIVGLVGDTSIEERIKYDNLYICLLYTSPSPRDRTRSRMPSSA